MMKEDWGVGGGKVNFFHSYGRVKKSIMEVGDTILHTESKLSQGRT